MKFIDEAEIQVQAGHGGSGSRHFRREKFVPLGGPDGGNGGAGGSVIIVADRNKQTLLDFQFRPLWKAQDGNAGEGSNREGKTGEDLVLRVPVGTQVLRAESDEIVADLSGDNQEFVIAKGGRGGKGNAFFKTPTNRAPEHFQPGEPGESGTYRLSLKLVADVGIIGFPNAGKSTLISRISSARPKIADYPFTTLTPNLGVVRARDGRSFVVADIPGLIPGAHAGKGLGIKFLKHIERTKILVHLIDPYQLGEDGAVLPPSVSYDIINSELKMFSEDLARKPQLVAITKLDTLSDAAQISALLSDLKQKGVTALTISSVSGHGLDELTDTISKMLTSID